MKKLVILSFLIFNRLSYSEIKIRVKPLEFQEIRAQNSGLYNPKAKARGIIMITTDNLEEDIGKLVKFKIPKQLILNNGKNLIKSENINFENKKDEIIIEKENEKLIYFVILDKKELSQGKNQNEIEGDYLGTLPLNYSIYDKEGDM